LRFAGSRIGWLGTLYDRARYEYRGKFAQTRFKRECLREYAETFKTVCVDAAYYTFPSTQYLEGMVNQQRDKSHFAPTAGLPSPQPSPSSTNFHFRWFGEHASDHVLFVNDQLAVKFIEEIDFVQSLVGRH
jgi:hypothetical protein